VEESTHFFHEFIVVEENADGCLELIKFKLLKEYFRLLNVRIYLTYARFLTDRAFLS